MSETALLVDRDTRGVARVVLNRPEVHNAFDDALIGALTAALRALDADDRVRVVVLEGKGRHFSAGADLRWMRRTADYPHAENVADARALARLMRTLAGLGKPTVARVQGAVYGGGVGLVACSDIAVAGAGARFCLSEVKLGLVPAVIGPFVVAAIGERAARRYMLSAEPFDSATAERLGLVHAVVPDEAQDTRVAALVNALLDNGPQALRATKALLASLHGRPIDAELMEACVQCIAERRASAEGREGVAAFLEKRPPGWRGKS